MSSLAGEEGPIIASLERQKHSSRKWQFRLVLGDDVVASLVDDASKSPQLWKATADFMNAVDQLWRAEFGTGIVGDQE
jgi:hypothetical protein